MQVIHQNKERSTGVFASKQDYKAGEEREVMKYLRIMGLDPMSSTSVDLSEIPMFSKGVAGGLIPNFAEGVKLWDQPGEMSPFNKKHRAGEKLDQLVRMIDKWVKYAETTDDVAKINERLKKAQEYMDMADDLIASGDLRGSGFVPNFANPLREAISREIGAGVPKSRIRVEQSGQLKSAVNPMGLAVTNTRDEPAGINQGIRRARSQGIDPRVHGAGRGFIPGFAEGDAAKEVEELLATLKKLKKSQVLKNVGKEVEGMLDPILDSVQTLRDDVKKLPGEQMDDETKRSKMKDQGPQITKLLAAIHAKLPSIQGSLTKTPEGEPDPFQEINDKLEKFGEAVEGATEEAKESDNAFGGSLQNLFFFQSLISGANGFLQEFAESTDAATRNLGKLGLTVSDVVAAHVQQKQIIGEIMNADWAKRDGPDDKPAVSLFGDNNTASVFSGEGWAKGGKPGGGKQLFGGLGKSIGPLITNAKLLAKGLTRFLPLVGQLYTAFTLVNKAFTFFTDDNESMMDLMSSGVTRATKRLEEMGKVTEQVTGILTDVKKVEDTTKSISDLETKGIHKTLKEEKELADLRTSRMKLQAKNLGQMGKLIAMSDSNLTAEKMAGQMFRELTTQGQSAASALEQIEKSMGGAELTMTVIKNFQEAINQLGGWDWWTDNELSALKPAEKKIAMGPFEGGIRSILTTLGPDVAKSLAQSMERFGAAGVGKGELAGVNEKAFIRALGDVDFKKGQEGIKFALAQFAKITDDETDAMEALVKATQQEVIAVQKNAKIQQDRTHSFEASTIALQKINLGLQKQEQSIANQLVFDKAVAAMNHERAANMTKSLDSAKAISASQFIQAKLEDDLAKTKKDGVFKTREIDEKYRKERVKELNALIEKNLNTKEIDERFFQDATGNPIDNGAELFAQNLRKMARTVGDGKVAQALGELAVNIDEQAKQAGTNTLDYQNIQVALKAVLTGLDDSVVKATTKALEDDKIISLSKEFKVNLEKNVALKKIEHAQNKKMLALEELKLALATEEEHLARRTVAGAKILDGRLKEKGDILDAILGEQMGSLENLKVENKFYALSTRILEHSNSTREEALQQTIKNNREQLDGEIKANAALASQLQLMTATGELGDETRKAVAYKLINEKLSAKLSLEETKLRADYFSSAKNAMESEKDKHEQAKLQSRIEYQATASRLQILRDDKDLGIQKKQELQMELMAAHTTIINNREKENQLKANKKLTKALTDAVFIQEQQNAVTEARNAIEMAALDQRKFESKQTLKFITEKAGAITQTREAAGRFQATGRTEDLKAYQDQLSQTNRLFNEGSRAMDALRSKLIDLDLAAENLGADLVNIGIDNARSGLVQMFKDIGTGAKTASEAWGDFGLGLANVLAERIMQHNVDQIIKNFTFAFTGESNDPEIVQKRMVTELGNLAGKLPTLTSSVDRLAAVIDEMANKTVNDNKDLVAPRDEAAGKLSVREYINTMEQRLTPSMQEIEAASFTYSSALNQAAIDIAANLKGVNLLSSADAFRDALNKKAAEINEKSAKELLNIGTKKGFASELEKDATAPPAPPAPVAPAPTPPMDIDKARGLVEDYNKRYTKGAGEWTAKKDFNYKNLGRVMKIPAGQPIGLDEFDRGLQMALSDTDPKNIKSRTKEFKQSMGLEFGATEYHRELKAKEDQVKEAKIKRDKLVPGGMRRVILETNQERIKKLKADNAALDKKTKITEKEFDAYNKNTDEIKQLTASVEKTMGPLNKATKEFEALQVELQKLKEAATEAAQRLRTQLDAAGINIKIPDPAPKQFGGRIQRFAKGGFVQGPPGKDNIPALLTAGEFVVPKEMTKGGEASAGDRVKSGALASAQALTMTLVAQEIGDAINKKDADKPPTFNMNKLNTLDLGSDVNLKRGDRRLSAKFLARDPVMQDYKDYLLDLAAFNVQQKNEKQREKMQTLGTIYGAVTSFAVAQASSLLAKPINKLVTKGQNFLGKHFGGHREGYRKALELDPTADYRDVAKAAKSGRFVTGDKHVYRPRGKWNKVKGSDRYELGDPGKGWGSDIKGWIYDEEASRALLGDNYPKQVGPWRTMATAGTHEANRFGADAWRQREREQYMDIEKEKLRSAENYPLASGGPVPAMLTAGEGYIPAPIAQRIGYNNLDQMNRTGSMPIIQGPGGIDNVGPVGLSEGDFIIKKSSTDKLLRENPNMMRFALQNPDGFKRGKTGYYEGGVVDAGLTMPASSLQPSSGPDGSSVSRMGLLESTETTNTASTPPSQSSETTNNININVSIDQSGAEATSETSEGTSYEQEKDLSLKIKGAVLDVIRQEKRIGGELS